MRGIMLVVVRELAVLLVLAVFWQSTVSAHALRVTGTRVGGFDCAAPARRGAQVTLTVKTTVADSGDSVGSDTDIRGAMGERGQGARKSGDDLDPSVRRQKALGNATVRACGAAAREPSDAMLIGEATRCAYNGRSEFSSVTNAACGVFAFAYDAVGNTLAAKAGGIQFAQRGISATFRHGEFAGKTIQEVAAGLQSGAISPNQLPLQTIVRDGVTYTPNNRSLMALREAGLAPTIVRDVTGKAFFEAQLTERLFEMGGSVPPGFIPIIRGGGAP